MITTRRVFNSLIRLLALTATLVAAIVMVTSKDSTNVFNLTFTAKYSNSPAFKYFVIAEALASAYNLVMLFLASKGSVWRLVIILDVVVAVMLVSSLSSALAIASVGKSGNSHAGWLPICGQVPKFCKRVTAALVAGSVAAILYFLLVTYTLYTVLHPLFVVKP